MNSELSNRIFQDIPEGYQLDVNHYVLKIKEACENKSLPVAYGPHLLGKQGKWLQEFSNNPDKLIMEIGCHKGKILSEIAQDNPTKAFVGLDITYKRVYEAAALAVENKLDNVKTLLADARVITQIFDSGELEGVVIFFPDPWIKKKKQAKKRLLNQEFCAILKEVLKIDGFIWFKTDSLDYFMNTQTFLTEAGFVKGSLDQTCFSKNYESTFERRFKDKGEPSYESVWIRQ